MYLEPGSLLDLLPLRTVWLVILIGMVAAGTGQARNALEHLRAAPPPVFRPGHTLPPLARWGWEMPLPVRIELTEHWGYALEFGGYATPAVVAQLDDPQSVPSQLCALTAKDPARYPLFVITDRSFPEPLPPECWTHDANGKLPEDKRIWSPEAPDAVFAQAAALASAPLRKIREKAPIALVLNGGEYALSVYGHHGKYWAADPRVIKARGEQPWFEYLSARKAHQETIIARALREACPDRELYIYYYADCCPHANRYGGWWTWAWGYEWMRNVSDLPSSSIYYAHFNSGWTGANDMLTQALNSAGGQLALGAPLSYNWVCAGWTQENLGAAAFGDLERYAGFLKCWYTAGMTGAVAGYFAFPPGGFAGDCGDTPPHWLQQMMVLGHVHALFSHLEPFLRQGCLLPGPDRHRWSKDQPACEFPTGDATARVLARKLRTASEWLVTAWAADGPERDVKATIPDLGELVLHARPGGSVYRVTLVDGRPRLTLVDVDALNPTAALPPLGPVPPLPPGK